MSKRSKIFPPATSTIICLIILILLPRIYAQYVYQSGFNPIPSSIFLAIGLVVFTFLFFYLLYLFGKKSINPIVLYLRTLLPGEAFLWFIALMVLFFLFQLVFSFYLANSRILLLSFIIFLVTLIIFLVISGVLILKYIYKNTFIRKQRKSFSNVLDKCKKLLLFLTKLNPVGLALNVGRSLLLKRIVLIGVGVYIIHLLLVATVSPFPVVTTGDVLILQDHVEFFKRRHGPISFTEYTVITLDTTNGKREFWLNQEQMKKCPSYPQTATIQHNFLSHIYRGQNKIIACS